MPVDFTSGSNLDQTTAAAEGTAQPDLDYSGLAAPEDSVDTDHTSSGYFSGVITFFSNWWYGNTPQVDIPQVDISQVDTPD